MQGSLDRPPITVRSSRTTSAWLLLIGTDLPDGRGWQKTVKPFFEKYFAFSVPQIRRMVLPVPVYLRGVTRRHETLDLGCGGRGGADRRAAHSRTAKPCGPGAPTLASSSLVMLRITRVMGARKPGPQGERGISRKTIAQGMPDCLR